MKSDFLSRVPVPCGLRTLASILGLSKSWAAAGSSHFDAPLSVMSRKKKVIDDKVFRNGCILIIIINGRWFPSPKHSLSTAHKHSPPAQPKQSTAQALP